MSAHDNGSENSQSCSINQNRVDFIEKFQEKHSVSKSNLEETGRWNMLYNQSKLKKMKEEQYRQKELAKRNEEMLAECTFNPNIYKNNYLATYQTENTVPNKRKDLPDISIRNEAWADRKKMHLEKIKQSKNNLELEQCVFKPELNPDDKLNKINIDKEIAEIVEDPESYTLYIARLNNMRKEEESKTERAKKLPGSGNIWNPKPKKYNFNYDYTKHEISQREFKNAKGVNSLSKPVLPKKFKSKLKMKNLDKDEYFDYLYTNTKRNETDHCKNYYNNNLKLIKFDKEMEFGKALEILHKELFSFKLMGDDDE